MTEELQQGMEIVRTVIEKVAEFLVNYSFEVIGALLILFVGHKASQWAGRATLRFLQKREFDPTLSRFAAGAMKGLILSFAIIVALGKFGITIAPIIAAVGALAFGGTLAIQGVLSNLASGLSLMVFRPFRAGDTIEVSGVHGIVQEVRLGCTILTNEDSERLTVPNRHIVGEVLRNSFANRVVETVVGISYGDDPERAIAAVRAALGRVPEVAATPPAIIGIREFGDSSINIGLRYWVPTKQYFQTAYAVNLAVHKSLKEAGITMPFPQRDVHLVSQLPGGGK